MTLEGAVSQPPEAPAGVAAFGFIRLKSASIAMFSGSISNLLAFSFWFFSSIVIVGLLIPEVGVIATAERKVVTAVTSLLQATASGMGAVEGKELAENHAKAFGMDKEKAGKVGEFLGSLSGPGLVGLAGQAVTKGLKETTKVAAAANITGTGADAQKAAASAMLSEDINVAISHAPEAPANIARAIELKKKVEGFMPNAAQMTNAPGLRNMYKEVANKSPEALAQAAQMEQANLAAIANYKERVFPAGNQSATNAARVKVDTDKNVFSLMLDKAGRDLRTLTDKFRRTSDNRAIGEELRTLYWEKRGAAKAGVDKELAGVYGTAAKYGIREDMTDIRQSVQKLMNADRTTFQDMPVTFSKILNEYPAATAAKMERVTKTPVGAKKPIYETVTTPGNKGNSVASFEEMHSLYKQANKDWIDAVAAGNPAKAHYMGLIKDQLQGKIAKYNDPKYGELAQKFGKYNETYSKYATTFREGAGGEISKRTKAGMSTDAEDIVSKIILQPGDKKKGVQDFVQIFGQDERAARLLHDGMLDNFSKAAVKDGTLSPARARAWMESHKTALEELPELSKALSSTLEKGTTLVNQRLLMTKQRNKLDQTIVAKIAGTENVEAVVAKAIADPKYMKGLLVGALTEESKMSIARAIADSVGKRADGYEFLMTNEKALKPALDSLGKDHWQNLKDIAEMSKIVQRTKAPTEVELTKLQDIGEKLTGNSVKSILSKVMAVKQGRVGEVYTVTDIGGRFFYKIRSEEMMRLRNEAMLNPELAEALVKMARQPGAPTQKQLLNLQAMSFAVGVNSVAQTMAGDKKGKE